MRHAEANSVAEVFAEIDQSLPPELLELPCSTLGLSPLDLIEATGGVQRTTVLRLDGELSDLFEQARSGESAGAQERAR